MKKLKTRSGQQLYKAIRKLVTGLEKQSHTQAEKRRYGRYPFNVKVQLCHKSESDEYRPLCEAWVSNLSIGGIDCIVEQKVFDRDLLYVNFEEIVGRPCYIPIRLCACRTLLSQTYQVHGEFIYDECAGPGQAAIAA